MLQMEVAVKTGIHLPKNKYESIRFTATSTKSWKRLVKEVLLHMYGDHIKSFCATGKRSSRPPIDPRLFEGLQGMIIF